jgi:transglutaminase-like putative cysteine protease
VRIVREELPAPLPLPLVAPDDARAALAPSPLIESDDATIVATARRVVGDATDAVTATRRLVEWVGEHLEKAPSVTVPSAREVLAAGRGDCNEHAALLTALARAAGIPARVVAGAVYADDAFYYHAWTEVWLGRWVSADSVFGQLPADATHVKLVAGDAEHYAALAGTIGKLAFTLEEVE